MKLLWKLNACVLLFCLGMSLCADATNQVQVQSKVADKLEIQSKAQTETSASLERHHKKFDMYEENEKMLDKMETSKLPSLKKSVKSSRSIHSFLEKQKNPIKSSFDDFEGQSFAETNQKPKKNKKSKVSKTNGITFIHLKNPKLADGSEWFGSNKCDFKKGFLEILKNENYVGNKVELEMARVLLTPESIKMFTTMDENSLFTTIKLQSILKISQEARYKNSGCFDIILNEAFISEKFLQKRRVTICAEDKISMGKWVHSIFEMKECNYDLVHKNSKIVLDFNEINKIKKDDIDMKGLFYDNYKKVNTNTLQKSKEHVIKKTVNNLIDTIQVRNMEGAKVARSLDDQLKQAQAFTREMDKKHEMIERIIKKKREQQSKLEIKSVKDKAVGKVVLLIKAMAEKIKDMKVRKFININFLIIIFLDWRS
jgi:hypothetical protein